MGIGQLDSQVLLNVVERNVDVLDFVDSHIGVLVVLGKLGSCERLHQLDELLSILEIGEQIIDL